MTNWSSANHRRKRILRRRIYIEALAFHLSHVTRLSISGRWDKLKHTGFVQRQVRRQRELRHDQTRAILP